MQIGRWRDTALCVAYGPKGHPFVRGIKELFVPWFKLITRAINDKNFPFLDKLDPHHQWDSWKNTKKSLFSTPQLFIWLLTSGPQVAILLIMHVESMIMGKSGY